METLTPHDLHYKRLFDHLEILRDLLMTFVPGINEQTLDFNTLVRAGESFTTEDGRARYRDRLWKVMIIATQRHLYVHLEIQSHPDGWMARRMHEYVGGAWSTAQNEREKEAQDAQQRAEAEAKVKNEAKPKAKRRRPSLSVVLPLVLYTGREKWGARRDVADLLEEMPSFMAKHPRPRQRYWLIQQTEWLEKIKLGDKPNFAAAVFLLQHATGWNEMLQVFRRLEAWFAPNPGSQLERDIAAFISWLLREKYGDTTIEDQESLARIFTVGQAHTSSWKNWESQGERKFVKAALERRFGLLPERTQRRLAKASEQQLAGWLMKLIDGAASLDDVLGYDAASLGAEVLGADSDDGSVPELAWQRLQREELRDLLKAGLERRFGAQTESLQERLSSASFQQLTRWILHLFDGVSSIEDVFVNDTPELQSGLELAWQKEQPNQLHDLLKVGLERRFWPLTQDTEEQIARASEEDITKWIMRFFEGVTSIEEIFAVDSQRLPAKS